MSVLFELSIVTATAVVPAFATNESTESVIVLYVEVPTDMVKVPVPTVSDVAVKELEASDWLLASADTSISYSPSTASALASAVTSENSVVVADFALYWLAVAALAADVWKAAKALLTTP